MASINRKIPKKYRYFFYFFLCLCVISGSCFWLLQNFGMVEGDFGPESHFLQYPMLQVHGFSAFMMLMSLGSIFSSHVTKTWSIDKAKKSGISLMSFFIFSTVSAYSLYYLVGEDCHSLLGNSHAIVGLSLPILLVIHVKVARKTRKKKQTNKILTNK